MLTILLSECFCIGRVVNVVGRPQLVFRCHRNFINPDATIRSSSNVAPLVAAYSRARGMTPDCSMFHALVDVQPRDQQLVGATNMDW